MKVFKKPEMEVLIFNEKDILTASSDCYCVECPTGCAPGAYDCKKIEE